MPDSPATPREVSELVERFDRFEENYLAAEYKEARLRQEFLDPLLEAIGWDVRNRTGKSERFKDVVVAEALRVGDENKEPDYAFRIGGSPVFYVEAKKPSVDITTDPAAALQLRRYSFTSGHVVGVLTNFRHLALYDARVPSTGRDTATRARISLIPYREYEARWQEIVDLLSPPAIERGSLEQLVSSTGVRRGTQELDEYFLRELESWRALLARGFVKRNRSLDEDTLGLAVQRTIDRILFLRLCEDRGIEPYRALHRIALEDGVYEKLCTYFKYADRRYNSGIFYFRREQSRSEDPDRFTLGLTLDDVPIRRILNRIYPPDSPYAFKALPADILGQVYERFLGNEIRVTADRRVRIEPKPEVRRAHGVYYTPTHIVDHIVQATVGRLLKDATLRTVSNLTFLDPACGSGSFLVRVYQYLLAWYEERYLESGTKGHIRAGRLFNGADRRPRLTLAERRRILLTHVFGVDIDPNAVEVTKLSLLLQVLDGETAPEARQLNMVLEHERALPDLGANVKCGDSLVDQSWPSGISERPFDWHTEFPNIFSARGGGFSAIVGNPPYDKISGAETPEKLKAFKERYTSATFKPELYAVFAERALSRLAAGGLHSFIVPNSFLMGTTLAGFRSLLAEKNTLIDLAFLKNVRVFKDAQLDSVVYVVRHEPPSPRSKLALRIADANVESTPEQVHKLSLSEWLQDEARSFGFVAGGGDRDILVAIERRATPLRDIATVHLGLVPESNELVGDDETRARPDPILRGRDIARYGSGRACRWFSFKNTRIVGGTKAPWVYEVDRIVLQAIRNLSLPRRLVATLTKAGTYTDGTLHNIIAREGGQVSLPFLVGVLNSAMMNYFYAAKYPEHRIKGAYLESLPIQLPSGRRTQAAAAVERLSSRMLEQGHDLDGARSEPARNEIARRMASTDRDLDRAVCELYGLSASQVSRIEAARPD
ncbi:MAG: hypothetical protein A2138_22580 [Deltaproteobacteria bacterium RBG_16_71_12]|nr:MAG: hypothetical protein A2138_22580 [Deltaproteobacteria bacterium RBG_16_71_12]